MTKIVDQLLQLAEFIEKRRITDDSIVAAGTNGFSISLHLECKTFFSVVGDRAVEYSDCDYSAHGYCSVDGIPLVCVADNEAELQKLRAIGKPQSQSLSLGEMPF